MLSSLARLKSLRFRLAQAAQEVYDAWDENEDEYAGGGICHLIADAFCEVLDEHDIDCVTFAQEIGEVHVFVIAKVKEGVFSIDIPPGVYEEGAGYNWRKIEDVVFDSSDVFIDKISSDPNAFDEYLE